jgi:O-antigen/teichoic acid export membrane protein
MTPRTTIGTIFSKTATASAWTVGARLFGKTIDFVTLLILARMLGPHDFGLIGTAMTAIFVIEAVLELPLGAALVRVTSITDRMFHTAFTLGLLRGLTIALILGALAWPLSAFYGEDKLAPLILALAIAPIMRGLISPRMALFAKELDFRRDLILETAGKLLALIAAVTVAATGGTYWAIAAATITAPTVMMTISYVLAPMRPRLTLRDWAHFSDLVGWNTLSQAMGAMNWQIDRIALPRFVEINTFGKYAIASDLVGVLFQSILNPIGQPVLSSFVMAHQIDSLKSAYLRTLHAIVAIIAPVCCFVSLIATPIVSILLGKQWLESATILSPLALIMILALPGITMAPLAVTLKQTRMVAIRTFVDFVTRIPLTIVGAYCYGIGGVISAKIVAQLVSLIAVLFILKALVNATTIEIINCIMDVLISVILATLVLHLLNIHYNVDDDILSRMLYMSIVGVVFVGAYVGSMTLIWRIKYQRPCVRDTN